MKTVAVERFESNKEVKMTPLRQEILAILALKTKPMGAYEILEKLKKKRANAEPMTVYRVLNYLVEAKLVHRIESQNTYICCSQASEKNFPHKSVLLFCKQCNKGFEHQDVNIFAAITKFAKKNNLIVDDTLIEMKGICHSCSKKKNA